MSTFLVKKIATCFAWRHRSLPLHSQKILVLYKQHTAHQCCCWACSVTRWVQGKRNDGTSRAD